ncbi:MAG: Uma2 family endonuclease [Deinococcota bacterium]
MDKVLEPVAKSPKLALYMAELEKILVYEKQQREQFYREMQEGDKTEFINGEIIMHSPVKNRHTSCGRRLVILLGGYVQEYNLGFVGYETTLISLTRNDYEPDLYFFGNAKASMFQPEQMIHPAPEFIVEILSKSTEARDRGIKFEDYAAHSVQEYWLVDPEGGVLEQYLLQDGTYTLALKSADGHVASPVIEGLKLPIRAIFDDAVNIQTLQELLANKEDEPV